MKYFKACLVLILASLILPITAYAENLGQAKLFRTHSGNPSVELTLVQLGDKKEKRILAHFNTPEYELNDEYNVYQGQCQTTRCNTVSYKVIGGMKRNFVSQNSYYGDYFELILPGRNKPLAVYYDEKKSKTISSEDIYNKYLVSIGRSKTGNYNADQISQSLNDALSELQQTCKSKAKIKTNIAAFQKNKSIHLIGMGKHYLTQIALKCSDADYQEELKKITVINFLPENKVKAIELKTNELFIYLSEKSYNPKYETELWLDNI